nr:hypothetical protein [Clostridium sp. AM45-5]
MLDTQINMYSVDTGHFYTNKEKYYHDKNCAFRRERSYLDNHLLDVEKKLIDLGWKKENVRKLKNFDIEEANRLDQKLKLSEEEVLVKEYYRTVSLIIYKRMRPMKQKTSYWHY